MPSSGHVEEINRRAKAQNDERRAYQEKEAQCVLFLPLAPLLSHDDELTLSTFLCARRTGNGVYRWRTHGHDGR